MSTERGFGVAGALDREILRELAAAAEHHGYRTFWVNDTPGGDGLEALAAAAASTSDIRLGVGVIALDRQPAGQIASRVAELDLPVERLTLGIGSGAAKDGAVDLVETGAAMLRDLTESAVVIGALGPKMCAAAGRSAAGVLLNWLIPSHVAPSANIVRRAAAEAGRPAPRIDGYVRTALGSAALPRLRQEAARYASFPSYAAHFTRMGVEATATCIAGESRRDIQDRLAAFEQELDEVIVRAITAEESLAAYLELLRSAAPVAD